MLDKNADRFPSVYDKAEQLMRDVEKVDLQFAVIFSEILPPRNYSSW